MRRRRYLAICGLAAGTTLAGCNTDDGDDDGGNTGAYEQTFRDSLTRNDIEIHELTVADGVVDLVYSPDNLPEDGTEEEYEARVEETVATTAESFFDRVYGGWDVDRLESTVRIGDEVVATWRMEREWIERYLDGEYTREDMGERVEGSVERHYETDDGAEDGADDDAEGDTDDGGENDAADDDGEGEQEQDD